MSDVANGAPTGCKFFNIYLFNKEDVVIDLVRDAERNGYQALVVTIDSPACGTSLIDESIKRDIQRLPFE